MQVKQKQKLKYIYGFEVKTLKLIRWKIFKSSLQNYYSFQLSNFKKKWSFARTSCKILRKSYLLRCYLQSWNSTKMCETSSGVPQRGRKADGTRRNKCPTVKLMGLNIRAVAALANTLVGKSLLGFKLKGFYTNIANRTRDNLRSGRKTSCGLGVHCAEYIFYKYIIKKG